MKYQAVFSVEDADAMAQAFKPEQNLGKKDRASLKIARKKNRVTFSIQANDIIALKSSFTSVLRALEIYEKIKRIK